MKHHHVRREGGPGQRHDTRYTDWPASIDSDYTTRLDRAAQRALVWLRLSEHEYIPARHGYALPRGGSRTGGAPHGVSTATVRDVTIRALTTDRSAATFRHDFYGAERLADAYTRAAKRGDVELALAVIARVRFESSLWRKRQASPNVTATHSPRRGGGRPRTDTDTAIMEARAVIAAECGQPSSAAYLEDIEPEAIKAAAVRIVVRGDFPAKVIQVAAGIHQKTLQRACKASRDEVSTKPA